MSSTMHIHERDGEGQNCHRARFFDDDAQGEAWWAPKSGIPAKTGVLSPWLIRKYTKFNKALSS